MTEHSTEILVVEDDPLLAESLRRTLEPEGFHVHLESSGPDALSYATEHRPRLVILDLRLPGMNGYHVCRELRRSAIPG